MPSDGPKPNLADFVVIDSGQTIKLGNYEAATDAVLYEFDADFRKQERKRAAASIAQRLGVKPEEIETY